MILALLIQLLSFILSSAPVSYTNESLLSPPTECGPGYTNHADEEDEAMADFSEYRESGENVDRAVQHALRETDPAPLAMAMVTMAPEDRQIILRNMSKRASGMLIKDIEELERQKPGTYDRASAARQEEFLRKVKRFHRLVTENERLTPAELPRLTWEDEEGLIRGLVALKRYATRNGAASLEPLLSRELHPLLRKGIGLYVDGWDPAVVQSVLEQMRDEQAGHHYRGRLLPLRPRPPPDRGGEAWGIPPLEAGE